MSDTPRTDEIYEQFGPVANASAMAYHSLCCELERELTHARKRWKWWQKNAEDIAVERGELFRAGEAMREVMVGHCWDGEEVGVWDAAAQPIRDMVSGMGKITNDHMSASEINEDNPYVR